MSSDALEAAIVERIRANGPMGFDEYVAHALYTPELGFYAGGGGAGRGRDFLTSPEVGPLFGAVLGRALDAWWTEVGRPDTFTVVEAGAGRGALARAALAAAPACSDALRLVLVEPAQTQWLTHPEGVESRVDLPAPGEVGDGPVVVLANELLDNLPFALVERTGAGWREVVVTVDEGAGGPLLREGFGPLSRTQEAWCEEHGGEAPVGARLPVQSHAAAWLADALALASGGRVVVIDYTSTSGEMARRPWAEWVRTYSAHGRAGHPLERPGSRDITVEVAEDQLATVARPSHVETQAEFLRRHGLDDLVAEGRSAWHERGDVIDLAAIAGRSRVGEAEALCDPNGLGAFTVLQWIA